ncbi:carbohydrate binding family 9 domain-containing protein [Massilia sp. CFBP9026]|uniref:carbohydrate binding family 9 domain-containing protein n=1 Tax=Massilia sp. CFBP9026 TaxID=3096536 RepID=UPI002A6AB55E|nr:carbohydrate binding family 9 domain-containing protein [Massilia sp. CFBP9026]MDY0961618.1 carbohydrate binding family 9 domain-containing protein [Massilia sp. CFBP9026]
MLDCPAPIPSDPSDVTLRRLLVLFAAFLGASAADASGDRDGLRALRIGAPEAPAIDGVLDEAAWQRAPLYDDFHKHLPRDGEPAPRGLRTTVQLLVDDGALVFGIRAWDPAPERRRGQLARRDKVAADQDFIGIWIDPAGHGRSAQFVRINTLGVVSDGIHRADDDESDLGPDFPVETAVKLLPDGYSMEVRWPLSNLRFPYADGRNWRMMVERSIPHAQGALLVTAPFRIDALSHLSFLQEIAGMDATVEAVRDRGFVELRPELTVRSARAWSPGQRMRGSQAELGLEINARPRADWVFNATINPDFSQVEIDEPVSQGASNVALSLPEKRGFFLESADVLGLPLPAFYSRTVNDPEYGLRATWRGAHMDATAMSLRDEPGGLVLRGRPYETLQYAQTLRTMASLARARWHQDGLLLGAFVSQRDYHRFGSNEVLGLDAQWRGETDDGVQHQLSGVAMASRTTAGFTDDDVPAMVDGRSGGYLWGKYLHKTARWWHEAEVEAIAPGFVNDNGFVPQAGIARITGSMNRILGPQSLGALELYEFETYLIVHEMRTLSDNISGQRGGETVERKLQPGVWMAAPLQTGLWVELGFDRQRAGPGGRLHDTRVVNFGVETTPAPWISKIAAEVALGRQLDVDADRVGPGGNVILDVGLRFPLRRGWSLELDHHVNRAWVQGTLGQPAFSDTAWRWLAMLHFSSRDSLRLLAQNTWAARRDDGVTQLEAWNDRQVHRSLLYRHQWRVGRTVSFGIVDDKLPLADERSRSLTFKLQWEV